MISTITFELNPLKFSVSHKTWYGRKWHLKLYRRCSEHYQCHQWPAYCYKILHTNRTNTSQCISLIKQWFHANMRKKNKNAEKNIVFRAEKTPPQISWPITTLATMVQLRHNIWGRGSMGARFTAQALNTCALSIHKYTFEMCGLWGRLIFV